jgi:glycolate oxidase FAD binding subunit
MAGATTHSPRWSELEAITPAAAATAADAVCGRQPERVVEPASQQEVAAILRWANENAVAIAPRGNGTKSGWGAAPSALDLVVSLRRMNRVLEHVSGDMTATVEPGCTVADFQRRLAEHGQRLAVEPLFPERATIGGILACNDSGPLRVRFGSLRDLLIGVTLALPDGTLARSGGKVVKNVAGYDLPKLAIGSLGTLGIITQAIFRLHPLPKAEQTLSFEFANAAAANRGILALLDSVLTFTGLQLRLFPSQQTQQRNGGPGCLLDVRFEGVRAAVEDQARRAERILRGLPEGDGGTQLNPADASAEVQAATAAWSAASELWQGTPASICKFSVLPGEIGSVLEHARSQAEPLGVTVRGVVQAVGTGLLRLDGSDESLASLIRDLRSTIAPRHGSLVLQHGPEGLRQQVDLWGDVGTALRLMRRMKEQFDPKGILNRGRFVGGI